MGSNQELALQWLTDRAAENTAHPEENAVVDYLIKLVKLNARTAPIVDATLCEQKE